MNDATDQEERHINWTLGTDPIEVDAERGYFKGWYQGRPELSNGRNIVQGGILGAMLDNAMAYAAMARLGEGRHIMSLEMKTTFMAPAPLERLIGEGWVVKMGRSIAFLEARISDQQGTVLATASSTARIANAG